MDNTREMVETLKAGHKVKLVVARGESFQNAHAVFNRIEREHNVTIGRIPLVSGTECALVAWIDGLAERPHVIGY